MACPVRRAEAEQATAAHTTCPTLYKVHSHSAPAPQSLPIQFYSSPHPTPFTANQGQPPPQPQTILKRAQQSTAPLVGELADDSSVAVPQQGGPMEGISPALPLAL